MALSITTFNENKAGFDMNDVHIPVQVLRGPATHRVDKGECEIVSKHLHIHRGDIIDAYQIAVSEDETNDLKEITYSAYRDVLLLIKQSRKNLLRVWNFIPDILGETEGRERYHLFNEGRFNALNDMDIPQLPAATGIGGGENGNPLIIQMLATKETTIHLQNPLQKPPKEYSEKYGIRPPMFSRATLHAAATPELYIAGTAAVRGEASEASNNIAEQVSITIENLQTLLSQENLEKHGIHDLRFQLKDIDHGRVYLKHESDYPIVRSLLENSIGRKQTISYLRNDICRPELLIEIEGCIKAS